MKVPKTKPDPPPISKPQWRVELAQMQKAYREKSVDKILEVPAEREKSWRRQEGEKPPIINTH